MKEGEVAQGIEVQVQTGERRNRFNLVPNFDVNLRYGSFLMNFQFFV